MCKFYIALHNFSIFYFSCYCKNIRVSPPSALQLAGLYFFLRNSPFSAFLRTLRRSSRRASALGVPPPIDILVCLEQDKVYLVFTNLNLNKYHKRSYKVIQTIQYLIVCGDLENFECRNEIECFKCKFVDQLTIVLSHWCL